MERREQGERLPWLSTDWSAKKSCLGCEAKVTITEKLSHGQL